MLLVFLIKLLLRVDWGQLKQSFSQHLVLMLNSLLLSFFLKGIHIQAGLRLVLRGLLQIFALLAVPPSPLGLLGDRELQPCFILFFAGRLVEFSVLLGHLHGGLLLLFWILFLIAICWLLQLVLRADIRKQPLLICV